MLWFGDERGYNATATSVSAVTISCGLVMKEDITQQSRGIYYKYPSCGLVMKEDITQRAIFNTKAVKVVVW